MVKIISYSSTGIEGFNNRYTTGHYITNSFTTSVDEALESLKEKADNNETFNEQIIQIINEIKGKQCCCNGGGEEFPIEEADLNTIYEKFIQPYLECEIYKMGSIMDVITLNKVIKEQIDACTSDKTRYLLNIIKDIMTVLVNARNQYFDLNLCKKNLLGLQKKYGDCTDLVYELQHKIKKLEGNPDLTSLFKGELKIVIKQPKNLIYAQAKLDLDYAWYQYLHNTKKIDPEVFASTIAYVRSFGTFEKAYNKLIELLDDHFKDVVTEIEENYQEQLENSSGTDTTSSSDNNSTSGDSSSDSNKKNSNSSDCSSSVKSIE